MVQFVSPLRSNATTGERGSDGLTASKTLSAVRREINAREELERSLER
jgi:hypothetical protein